MTEGTDNFSQVDSTQSVNGKAAPPFDPVIMAYATSLPASISSHSVFTLAKPSSVLQVRKPSCDSTESAYHTEAHPETIDTKNDNADYDFIKTQLSPDLLKKKHKVADTRECNGADLSFLESEQFLDSIRPGIESAVFAI